MDPDVVLGKTEAGLREIQGHGHDLPRSLRHVLILVDGRSSIAQLGIKGSMIPDLPGALQELIARGLVAPVRAGAGAVAGPAPAGHREALENLARGVLGTRADKVVRKLQGAGASDGELATAVEACYKLIRLTIDERSAEEFRASARAILARSP